MQISYIKIKNLMKRRFKLILILTILLLSIPLILASITIDSGNLTSQRGSADVCGNGVAQPGEDCNSCPADAGCASGFSCTLRNSNWTCVSNNSTCGNNIPDNGETCNTCPNDIPNGTCVNCGNGKQDAGETCNTCPQDVISTGGICVNCGNGRLDIGENCASCPQDSIARGGACSSCNYNRVCDIAEGCGCTDCFNSTDGCSNGNRCNTQTQTCGCNTANDGICSSDPACGNIDPDCCIVKDASWSTECSFDKLPVNINVKTGVFCNNKNISFEIKEDNTVITPGPNSVIVQNGSATSTWIAKRSATCLPVIGCNPKTNSYYFVTTLNQNSKIFDTKKIGIRDCDVVNDVDCDGIINNADECPRTKSCTVTVNSKGCDISQATCYAEWDCSAALWSDCNEDTGKRTRDISRCIFKGAPNSPCANITNVPREKDCLVEQEFPVFTNFNVFISLILLIGYYIYRRRLK